MSEPGIAELEKDTKSEEKIKNKAIEELEEPLAKVLSKIISQGAHYDMIIGDDTSARIPTLIIAKVLNSWYKSQNLEPADVRFAYGKSGQAEIDVASVFEHIKAVPAKVLLATEHIESGEHMAYLAGALDRRGVNFDIASLHILRSEEYYRRELPDIFRQDISFYTGESDLAPSIYGNKGLTGLRRGQVSSTKPKAIRRAVITQTVRQARKDASTVAERLKSRFGIIT